MIRAILPPVKPRFRPGSMQFLAGLYTVYPFGIQCIAMKEATTSERIAEEALKILEKEGEDAVSMRRVAQAVGITPMAIYHHFPNREALLNFITDREFAKFLGYIQARPMRGSMENWLLNYMDAYIEYAFDRPRIFDYVFSQPRPNAR